MIGSMQHAAPQTRRERRQPVAGPVPDAGRLREAALAHLARFAATEAGLLRVLERRVRRWSDRAVAEGVPSEQARAQAGAARDAARAVVAALVAGGVLDDGAYAESRARSLARGGRSRRAMLAHLTGRGVDAELARSVLPEDGDTELAAALLQARRRRIGPFAAPDAGPGTDGHPAADSAARNRQLATLARAGFSRDIAERALDLDREAAEALILALRRG